MLAGLRRQAGAPAWHQPWWWLEGEPGTLWSGSCGTSGSPSPRSYPENGVVTMSSRDVRARARTIIKWQELQVGQVVMLNYNPDHPKERGFWYDAEITRKRETRTARELYASVKLG